MLPGCDTTIFEALRSADSESATFDAFAPVQGCYSRPATSLPTSTSTQYAFQTFASKSFLPFGSVQPLDHHIFTSMDSNLTSATSADTGFIGSWRSTESSNVSSPVFSFQGTFDQHLESPLGLASFSGSPTGWDEELPALDFDHDIDVSLFPTVDGNAIAGPSSERMDSAHVPGSTFTAPSFPSFAPPPPQSDASTSSSRSKRSKAPPTGFKGPKTTLLPLDAPVQHRSYSAPSATSRKADKVSDVEKKRLQNTISARKSRARKQERLDQLEEENEILRAECERLKQLVHELGGQP